MAGNKSFLRHLNIWVFGVGSKLVPCILLTYLSFSLIHVLIEADKRKRRLQCANRKPPSLKTKNLKLNPPSNQSESRILSNSPSTIIPLALTQHETIDSTISNRSIEKQQQKCLTKPSNQQLLKTTTATDHLDSNGTLAASSDSNQTVETCLNQEIATTNFDCNNNSDANQLDINQPLTAHNSINNSKEKLNKIADQKRYSTSSITKHFVIDKSRSKDLKKDKNVKLSTPSILSSSTIQTPTIQGSNVYLQSSQSDRTTKMLISVLLIFLLCEFPSGILILLSSILGE